MFKVLFVDDEDIIREGFSSRIPWEECGYDFKGTFEDGSQVLDYLKNNTVDLIISDICMPKVDGLELSKIVTTQYPQIKILLLTGYDDFEYAREAIKYESILELVLKPVTSAEFTEILQKTSEKLTSHHNNIKDRALLEEKLKKSFPLLKKRFLYRMAGGRMSKEEWNQRKDFIQLSDREKWYQILIVSISPEEDEFTRLEKEETIWDLLKKGDELFQNRDEQIVLFLQGVNEERLSKNTVDLSKQIMNELKPHMETVPLLIGIGKTVPNIEDLTISYDGAKNSITYLQLTGSTGFQHISDLRDKNQPDPEWRKVMEDSFTEILQGEKTENAVEIVDRYFSRLKEYYITTKDASFHTNRLFYILLSFVEDTDLLSADDRNRMFSNLKDRPDWDSIDEASDWLKKIIKEISSVIKEKRDNTSIQRIAKAKQLIEQNYSVFDYSLHELCRDLYISPSHFSAVFKEGTGKTFVEYLTALRIEKAKLLLKTTELKTYEIAEKAGYRDPRYFSMIFKKGTSMTTSEFRSSLK